MSDSFSNINTREDVLGYRLIHKIGSGGYGEVWEAEAPGGLKKAIKVIFGYHDERRAQAELKALQRIKDVRHPFLLSLERIDIVDGKMVVVTELADQSLADLFQKYQTESGSGIPRDELLGYMRDIADALDFLSEKHELQHLDIKPENLLLVGGHVKVADFGLVKDIRQVSQSLMSGLTPTYAAPELFDGRPCRETDQYSLAIVYQEMLTTERPFSGTTPAQLAAQHMHGRPNLKSLPISDQAVIARALSKNPKERYSCCRAMVDELMNRRSRKKKVRSRTTIAVQKTREFQETQNTVVFHDNMDDHSTAIATQPMQYQPAELAVLGAPELDSNDPRFRPTLIVGLGQTANQVISRVKQRLIARYGSMEQVPGIQLLCIACDRDDLTRLSMSGTTGEIDATESLAIPLKKPEEYRSADNRKFSWLSRRWIYNIPRNMRTEGLRPLGRLALADNFDAICSTLHQKIETATLEENVAQSCETLEMSPDAWRPRVFVLSSISGGLGSGATLDLAYTVRLMLAERGIVDSEVIGMLMFGVNTYDRDPSLCTANALAALTELRHYTDRGYPGDETLGIPEFDEEAAFDSVYFLNSGQVRSPIDLKPFIDRLAEYLTLSSATPCGKFLDACREMELERESFDFRTFGISVSGPGNRSDDMETSNRIAHGLLSRWLKRHDQPLDMSVFAADAVQQVKLDVDSVKSDLLAATSRFEPPRPDDLLGNVDFDQSGAELAKILEEKFETAFGIQDAQSEVNPAPPWQTRLEQFLLSRAERKGDELADRITALMRTGKVDFQAYQAAIQACREIFNEEIDFIKAQAEKGTLRCSEILHELRMLDRQTGKDQLPRQDRKRMAIEFARLKEADFHLYCRRMYYRAISRSLTSVQEIVNKFKFHMETLCHSWRPEEDLDPDPPAYTSVVEQQMVESVLHDVDRLIDRAEAFVHSTLIEPAGGFFNIANSTANWRQKLPETIRFAAQKILGQAFRQISIERVIAKNNFSEDLVCKWIDEQVNAARPSTVECGGGLRLLIGLPSKSEESQVADLVRASLKLDLVSIPGTAGDVVFCFEGEGIPLPNIAYHLLQYGPEAMELVPRIYSRTDIEWSGLSELV